MAVPPTKSREARTNCRSLLLVRWVRFARPQQASLPSSTRSSSQAQKLPVSCSGFFDPLECDSEAERFSILFSLLAQVIPVSSSFSLPPTRPSSSDFPSSNEQVSSTQSAPSPADTSEDSSSFPFPTRLCTGRELTISVRRATRVETSSRRIQSIRNGMDLDHRHLGLREELTRYEICLLSLLHEKESSRKEDEDATFELTCSRFSPSLLDLYPFSSVLRNRTSVKFTEHGLVSTSTRS